MIGFIIGLVIPAVLFISWVAYVVKRMNRLERDFFQDQE